MVPFYAIQFYLLLLYIMLHHPGARSMLMCKTKLVCRLGALLGGGIMGEKDWTGDWERTES